MKQAIPEVASHAGGVVPRFERTDIEPAHDRLIEEMRSVYQDDDIPPYLDARAQELLMEGRSSFRVPDCQNACLVEDGGDLQVFVWRGSHETAVFGAALAMAGLPSSVHDLGLTLPKTAEGEGGPLVRKLADLGSISAGDVAAFVRNISKGKFAAFVPDDLARAQWARQNQEIVVQVPQMAREALS